MLERKYFGCREFEHIVYNCRNVKSRQEEGLVQRFLNKFEVLKSRVMNIGKRSRKEIGKDRKTILREERARKGVDV